MRSNNKKSLSKQIYAFWPASSKKTIIAMLVLSFLAERVFAANGPSQSCQTVINGSRADQNDTNEVHKAINTLSVQEVHNAGRIDSISDLVDPLQEAATQLTRILDSEDSSEIYRLSDDFDTYQKSINPNWKTNLVNRVFPLEFFQRHFASKGISIQEMQSLFLKLNKNFADIKMSNEALLLIAFTARKNPKILQLELEFNLQKVMNNLRKHFIQLDRQKALPHFKDFISISSEMFLEYAEISRMRGVMTSGIKLSPSDVAKQSTQYRDYLAEALKHAGELTLPQKIEMALSLVEPEFREGSVAGFSWLLVSRNSFKNKDRWLNAGAFFLALLPRKYFATLQSQSTRQLSNAETVSSFSQHVFKLVNGDKKLIEFIDLTIANAVFQDKGGIDMIPVIAQQTIQEFNVLFRDVRRNIDREKQKEKQQAESEVRPQISQPIDFNYTVKSKIKQTHIDHKTRAAKRAEARDLTEKEKAKYQKNEEPQKEVLPQLETIKLENAQADQKYFFKGFAGTALRGSQLQFVRFNKSLLIEFKNKFMDLEPWIKVFLQGFTVDHGQSGIKRIVGTRRIIWEIKMIKTGYRILVEQDKETGAWIWLDLINHDQLDQYKLNHKL